MALVVCVGVTAVTGGHRGYVGAPGWNGAPSATRAVTKCVDQHSQPGDQVLALSVADVVTDAHRKPVDRASLGIFSYQDVSSARADELHIFNAPTLVDLFAKAQPKIVVLSGFDVTALQIPARRPAAMSRDCETPGSQALLTGMTYFIDVHTSLGSVAPQSFDVRAPGECFGVLCRGIGSSTRLFEREQYSQGGIGHDESVEFGEFEHRGRRHHGRREYR